MKVDLEELEDVARMTAEKSTCRYKVAAILIDNKGKIISRGFNHRSSVKRMGKWTAHAEYDAIVNKIHKPSCNLTLVLYRKGNNPIHCCDACRALLKAYGISRILYMHEMIDNEEKPNSKNMFTVQKRFQRSQIMGK